MKSDYFCYAKHNVPVLMPDSVRVMLLYKISPVPICYSRQPPFHEMHHAGVPLFKKGLKTKRTKDT